MLEIEKKYVFDKNNNPIAVQISISEFQKIESILESYHFNQTRNKVTPKLSSNHGEGMINYLLKTPLRVESFTPMSREEVHERY